MGPLRELCQTLFVWHSSRGPQPATSLFGTMDIFCTNQVRSDVFLILFIQLQHHHNQEPMGLISHPVIASTDIVPASIRILLWAAVHPMHFGVR